MLTRLGTETGTHVILPDADFSHQFKNSHVSAIVFLREVHKIALKGCKKNLTLKYNENTKKSDSKIHLPALSYLPETRVLEEIRLKVLIR